MSNKDFFLQRINNYFDSNNYFLTYFLYRVFVEIFEVDNINSLKKYDINDLSIKNNVDILLDFIDIENIKQKKFLINDYDKFHYILYKVKLLNLLQILSRNNSFFVYELHKTATHKYVNKLYAESLKDYLYCFILGCELPIIFYRIGSCLYKLSKGVIARFFFEEAVKLRPKYNPWIYKLLLVSRGDVSVNFGHLLNNGRFLFEIGLIKSKSDRVYEALDFFISAKDKLKNDRKLAYSINYNIAQAYFKFHNYSKVIEYFSYFKAKKNHTYILALSYYEIGNYDKYLNLLHKIAHYYKYNDSLGEIRVHIKKARWDYVIEHIERFIIDFEDNYEAIYYLGLAYYYSLNYSKAIEYLESYLKMEDGNIKVIEILMDSYICLNKYNEIYNKRNFYEKYVNDSSIIKGLYTQILYVLKKSEDAIGIYRNEDFFKYYSFVDDIELLNEAIAIKCANFVANTTFPIGAKKLKKTDYAIRLEKYKWFITYTNINNNCILFESYMGNEFSCNSRALYDYISSIDGQFKFIIVDNKCDDSSRYDNKTIVVERESDRYLYFLASSKYLINNNTFNNYFIKRKEQIYINTWHGTPIKKLGFDSNSHVLTYSNVLRNFYQCSLLAMPNQYTYDYIKENYLHGIDVNHYIVGSPRLDKYIKSISSKKDVVSGQESRFILYAPTWRNYLSVEEQLDMYIRVLEILSSTNYKVYFKFHHEVFKSVNENLLNKLNKIKNIIRIENDIYITIPLVDILITDYSSIAIDFLPFRKKIIFFISDIETYQKNIGVNLEIMSSIGNICKTEDELREAILKDYLFDNKFDFAISEKGIACETIYNQIINNKISTIKNFNKKVVLVWPGLLADNGITNSYFTFIRNVKNLSSEYIFITIIDITSSSCTYEVISEIAKYSKIYLYRKGFLFYSRDRWFIKRLMSNKLDIDDRINDYLLDLMSIEFTRCFGEIKFDSIINYEGYSFYWTYSIASQYKKSNLFIYLHNDMEQECLVRYPKLSFNFSLYKFYDRLISVSDSINDVNKIYLSHRVNLTSDKFISIPNFLDGSRILALSKESLEEKESFLFRKKTFITIGRLSKEKNQELLIESFIKYLEKGNDANLLIIGDGYLKVRLETIIKNNNKQNNIILLGYQKNPFKYLAKSDCFIFPSLHEGMGLVLYEALILNKRIITSNIPTSKEIERFTNSIVVDNNIDSYVNALEHIFDEDNINTFDYKVWNKLSFGKVENVLNSNFFNKINGIKLNNDSDGLL